LRYACLQNPHLRPVNCGFSGCASLKLHLFIHLPENEAAKKYFLVSLFYIQKLWIFYFFCEICIIITGITACKILIACFAR
ncbi:MAG: hypothetical protein IJ277_03080, partial [Bacteroidaceae bacterium]|nr:hypothetical protein [Bacteroidaceae bacterium]